MSANKIMGKDNNSSTVENSNYNNFGIDKEKYLTLF